MNKQAQLKEYEKLCEIKRFGMMQISKQIEDLKRSELKSKGKQDIYKHAFIETKKELSKDESDTFIQEVKRKASIINNQAIFLNKKASTIFEKKFDAFTDIFKKEEDFDSSFNIENLEECSLEYNSSFEH
ncbi:unnamed protein product [Candida verbasci]|uniref:Uncharacterized protein n=1 Tax=Candida verbasci TaxID=1227364 RepID=A0A9W4TS79_9ASCO|nr:unnamed protein product [Candida verbasci]